MELNVKQGSSEALQGTCFHYHATTDVLIDVMSVIRCEIHEERTIDPVLFLSIPVFNT